MSRTRWNNLVLLMLVSSTLGVSRVSGVADQPASDFTLELGDEWSPVSVPPPSELDTPRQLSYVVYSSTESDAALLVSQFRVESEKNVLQNSMAGTKHGLKNGGAILASEERVTHQGAPGYLLKGRLNSEPEAQQFFLYCFISDTESFTFNYIAAPGVEEPETQAASLLGRLSIRNGATTGVNKWGGVDRNSAAYKSGEALGRSLVIGGMIAAGIFLLNHLAKRKHRRQVRDLEAEQELLATQSVPPPPPPDRNAPDG